jgi:hypothetical protein
MIPGLVEDPDLAIDMVLKLMEAYEVHPIKTAAGFRTAILGGLFAFSPALDIKEPGVNAAIQVIRSTVAEGRMIDFGPISNALIKEVSLKTRGAFEAGELQHPYEDWFGVSAWEDGMCGYYISTSGPDNEVLVIECYGVHPPGLPPSVVVNDVCGIKIAGTETFVNPIHSAIPDMNTEMHEIGRCGNMLDPLVTFLRFLSDASLPITDVPAPERLNKRRIAKGQYPIPAYTRVETRDYVSSFHHATSLRNEGTGLGHHSSPIPHWRRAHKRHLASGNVVPVRSTKVNWRESEELHRLFTRVKP